MKVIFNKDVAGVGKRFDIKNVSDGYAINFLFPHSLAAKASPVEVARVEKFKAEEMKKAQEHEALLVKDLKKISEIVLEMHEEANEKGHLFKGIHKQAIADAIKKSHNISFNPNHIVLDKPIKEVGDHKISLKIGDHNGFFTLKVSPTK